MKYFIKVENKFPKIQNFSTMIVETNPKDKKTHNLLTVLNFLF
jgi:hypothetical protein